MEATDWQYRQRHCFPSPFADGRDTVRIAIEVREEGFTTFYDGIEVDRFLEDGYLRRDRGLVLIKTFGDRPPFVDNFVVEPL